MTLIFALSLAACASPVTDTGAFLVFEGILPGVTAPAGGRSMWLELQKNWTGYTTDGTRVFKADDATYAYPPSFKNLAAGDRVKVWASRDVVRGQSPVYCVLKGNGGDGAAFALVRAADVEASGEGFTFRDADGDARYAVNARSVEGGALDDGALCFVRCEAGGAPSDGVFVWVLVAAS